MQFAERLQFDSVMLTTGSIAGRLRHEFQRFAPDFACFVHLFEPGARADLTEIFRDYMEIASVYDLPMLVSAPTWRAHPDGLARQGFDAPGDLARINGDAIALLQDLRRELALEDNIYIAGVIGPRFDGDESSFNWDAAAAEDYHLPQAQVLAASGVDLLCARGFAGAGELLGVARAAAATGLPYVLAPAINARGQLRDGSLLTETVARVDVEVSCPPLHFFIDCTHPSHVLAAIDSTAWPASKRVLGLYGSASSLSPEQPENRGRPDTGDPESFADCMVDLHGRGFKVLGGCRGTGVAHIRALAQRFAAGGIEAKVSSLASRQSQY
ncbi:MAG: homocysteine S-methyltransferase family protein [Dongiaceae bacterium]